MNLEEQKEKLINDFVVYSKNYFEIISYLDKCILLESLINEFEFNYKKWIVQRVLEYIKKNQDIRSFDKINVFPLLYGYPNRTIYFRNSEQEKTYLKEYENFKKLINTKIPNYLCLLKICLKYLNGSVKNDN